MLFTYSDASLTYGDENLPNSTGNYQIGIFERTHEKAEDTGEPYQQFKLKWRKYQRTYTFMLFEGQNIFAPNCNRTKTKEATTVNLIKEM